MKKQILFILTGLLIFLNSVSISGVPVTGSETINDGPYFYFQDNNLWVKWIENSAVKEFFVTPKNFDGIKEKFNLLFSYRDLSQSLMLKPSYRQNFKNADSIAVITDIHGEYHSYINLLKSNHIINKDLNWSFGKGHLVILGDIFDRGDMVTEVFWHLFGLQKQAAAAGGMVHLLLGNHELMTLSKNNGYLNEKYIKAEAILGTNYSDLYSENSVLGKWLRSWPTVMTIDNILFVHAGISIEMIHRNLKIKQINQLFSSYIVGRNPDTFKDNEKLRFLGNSEGPAWYRGYFSESDFPEDKIDSILDFYDKAHIVIGHTTGTYIRPLYHNKVFAIDAGIMNKLPGQMLIYKNGSFYRAFISGKRIKI